MVESTYTLPTLPPETDLETPEIMRALVKASRALAEFNGEAKTLPNQTILINTLFLQEALASSRIENIVTTQDEMFRYDLFPENARSHSTAAKEVADYREALMIGYDAQRKHGLITNNLLISLYQRLKNTDSNFRSTPGTVLKNENTGESVYVPPQHVDEIQQHMKLLEEFINDDSASGLDPLVKMAIIHHQFESIHPFSDGNGRVGRMLNMLYLTKSGLLDAPILYHSRAINRTRPDYYRLLQEVRESGNWDDWVVYMLKIVEDTAIESKQLVVDMRKLMASFKSRMRTNMPRIYSQDLLNNIFRHPYTKIQYVERDLEVSTATAARYLRKLCGENFLYETQMGRNKYFINTELVDLFMNISSD